MSFSRARKGWSADEVRDYLRTLADQIEAADAERTRLRAEVDRQRHEVHRLRSQGPEQHPSEPTNEPDAHAVALFSQAQQVADRLIEEAVQQARDLMSTARKQQRDILQQAHSSAEAAMHSVQQKADQLPSGGAGVGYEPPVPEVEYVRTFAKVAQVQLRSVLEALTEQVDRLGSLPDLDAEPPRRPDPTPPPPDPSADPKLGLRDLEWQAFSSRDKRSY
jgi:cell division initiation protein